MKKFFIAICLFGALAASAQVGVGTSTPDASAQLEVVSTSKGILIPRMTATQRTAIASPATGLLVFQTSAPAGFYYNAGTPTAPSWQLIGGAASSASMGLTATVTAAQLLPTGNAAVPATTINFNNVVSSNNAVGSFSGTAFTVAAAGLFSITANIGGSFNAAINPVIYVNSQPVVYGTGNNSSNLPGPVARGLVTATISLTAGDVVEIRASNINPSSPQPIVTDGTTRLTIVKL